MQYCLHAEPFFRKVFNLGCTETIQDRWKSHSQGVMQTETVVSTIKVENFIIILLAKSGKTDHQCLGQGKSKPLRNLPTHNLHEMQSHPTDKPKKPLQDWRMTQNDEFHWKRNGEAHKGSWGELWEWRWRKSMRHWNWLRSCLKKTPHALRGIMNTMIFHGDLITASSKQKTWEPNSADQTGEHQTDPQAQEWLIHLNHNRFPSQTHVKETPMVVGSPSNDQVLTKANGKPREKKCGCSWGMEI